MLTTLFSTLCAISHQVTFVEVVHSQETGHICDTLLLGLNVAQVVASQNTKYRYSTHLLLWVVAVYLGHVFLVLPPMHSFHLIILGQPSTVVSYWTASGLVEQLILHLGHGSY